MEIKPNVLKLMQRDALGFGLLTLIIILAFLIVQVLVVNLDPETDRETFVKYVWPWPTGAITLLWVVWPWIAYLWFINLKYLIKDERLIIHKGILNKKEVSVPYRAVTDFTLRRGFFERKLGIGALLVQTAGQSTETGGHEAKLEGLEDYRELHAQLRDKLKGIHQGGVQLGTVEEIVQDEAENILLAAILKEIKEIKELISK